MPNKTTQYQTMRRLRGAALLFLFWLAHTPPARALDIEDGGANSAECSDVPLQPMTLPGAVSRTYAAAGARQLRMHLFGTATAGDVASPRPAILLFFGGGFRVGSIHALEDQARAFAAHGYVAALADYRVRCRDGSTVLGALQDARAAYAWLRMHDAEFGIDRRRIVLGGGSPAAIWHLPAP